MGRPRKTAIPKQKKIKLSKAQKQYAKMIHNIEADLVKNQTVIEALGKKLTAITAELARHNGERENLEGAKKNLEGILAQIPPPEKWTAFTKYVYEYHHHYHHHDHTVRPYPVYIGPWWQYYYGGGYITYPSQSQLIWQGNGNIQGGLVGNGLTAGSPNLGGRNTFEITTCEALPNSTIVRKSSQDN